MSNYSEYIKKVKEQNKERFFKGYKPVSNKYFTFDHYISDDEVIVVTNNVTFVKGNPVLVVGSNKAVYLKDFCINEVHNYYLDVNAYAVSLKRQYFKTYTFKNDFEEFEIEKEETFDDFVEIAKEQDEQNVKVALGHF